MTPAVNHRNAVRTLLIAICLPLAGYAAETDPPRMEERVDSLVSLLTLQEKVDMMSGGGSTMDVMGCERLGIPKIRMHGTLYGGTAYPAPIAFAATFDTALVYELAVASGRETLARGKDCLLKPCVNICRMPIGGRNFETFSGEDPYLGARMAVNYIKGIQSVPVMPSIKHYALNNQEWCRSYVDVTIDERAMREIFLPAFEAATVEADPWCYMSSYNLLNGHHTSEHKWLLTDVLKKEWGFRGFVVSDWGGVHSGVNCVNAGQDVEMSGPLFYVRDSLVSPIREGVIPMSMVDDAVRRVLRARFLAGMMDRTGDEPRPDVDWDAHTALARKAGGRAVVLLKNEENVLPLDKSRIQSIAVIGPTGVRCASGGGGSDHVRPKYRVTSLEGIRNAAGEKIKVEGAIGDSITRPVTLPIAPRFFYTDTTLAQNGLQTQYFNNVKLEGEPVATGQDSLVDFDWGEESPHPDVNNEEFAVRWTGVLVPDTTRQFRIIGFADDGIRMYLDDSLILDGWRMQHESDYSCKVNLEKGRKYPVRIEFCDIHWGASLKLHWDLPPKVFDRSRIEAAAELASACDVALVFVGTDRKLESEGRDRDGLELPFHQNDLIKAVAKANPKTVVVITGGTPTIIDPWIDQVPGLIQAFFLGQETGNIIADILFGKVSPSGRLPYSYIKDYSQSPAFEHYRNFDMKAPHDEGIFVGYRYLEKNNIMPSFPFGFGLSYTTFSYGKMKVAKNAKHSYTVSVDVRNTGKVAGDEVVQLYVSDKKSTVERPVKELKGFARLSLAPAETKTAVMHLNKRSFAFYDVESKGWTVEPGKFDILVGASSADIRCARTIKVK